jgi:hypothetical protein
MKLFVLKIWSVLRSLWNDNKVLRSGFFLYSAVTKLTLKIVLLTKYKKLKIFFKI